MKHSIHDTDILLTGKVDASLTEQVTAALDRLAAAGVPSVRITITPVQEEAAAPTAAVEPGVPASASTSTEDTTRFLADLATYPPLLRMAVALCARRTEVTTEDVHRKFRFGMVRAEEVLAQLAERGVVAPKSEGRYRVLLTAEVAEAISAMQQTTRARGADAAAALRKMKTLLQDTATMEADKSAPTAPTCGRTAVRDLLPVREGSLGASWRGKLTLFRRTCLDELAYLMGEGTAVSRQDMLLKARYSVLLAKAKQNAARVEVLHYLLERLNSVSDADFRRLLEAAAATLR